MKFFNIISLILKGAPFRLPKKVNWNEIETPIFPFLFSFVSGALFSTIPLKIIKGVWLQAGFSNEKITVGILVGILEYGAAFCVLNGFILLFAYGLLRNFKKAAKVLYFSAGFQMLTILLLVLSDMNIFYSSPSIIIILFILRLFSAFMIMKRETNGEYLLSTIYALISLDAWFVLNIII